MIPPPGRWTQHSALNVQKTELHHPAIIPEFQVAPTHNRLLVVCQPWWRFAYLGGYFLSSSAGSDPTFPRHRHRQQNSFQKSARAAILNVMFPYDPEQRIRVKAARWKFRDSPRHIAQRLLTNFKVLQTRVPPAVRAT